jgi:hypothetical protein
MKKQTIRLLKERGCPQSFIDRLEANAIKDHIDHREYCDDIFHKDSNIITTLIIYVQTHPEIEWVETLTRIIVDAYMETDMKFRQYRAGLNMCKHIIEHLNIPIISDEEEAKWATQEGAD